MKTVMQLSGKTRFVAAICIFAMTFSAQAENHHGNLAAAQAALQAGEADKALAKASAFAQNAEAQNIVCRVYFTLRQWDAAVNHCETAVRLDQQNALYHLWLARALGEKADHVSFVSAYSIGKRVRMEFEQAVQLAPHNADALSDLGEFYQQAPEIIGGGTEKAAQIASRLDSADPARAHQLRARIAEGRKDYGTAEREFKTAATTSAHPALHWTTLASFYRRRKRWQDLDWAVRNAYTATNRDNRATVALYDGAGVLIEAHRDPSTAAKMLEAYLASNTRTEDGPAC